MSNGYEVLIYLSFLLKEAVIYLVAPNKHMVAMFQKLSFSDFILFYNSKKRHLEFLNLSPPCNLWTKQSKIYKPILIAFAP